MNFIEELEERAKVSQALSSGLSPSEVVDKFSIPLDRVHKYIDEYRLSKTEHIQLVQNSLRLLQAQQINDIIEKLRLEAEEGSHAAVKLLIPLWKRQADLLGLNMPTKHATTDSIGRDKIDVSKLSSEELKALADGENISI